jgi:hypothetical protein
MTEDELAWARTTTGCVGILQGLLFITLEGASIRHHRTIGGQSACYENESPAPPSGAALEEIQGAMTPCRNCETPMSFRRLD